MGMKVQGCDQGMVCARFGLQGVVSFPSVTSLLPSPVLGELLWALPHVLIAQSSGKGRGMLSTGKILQGFIKGEEGRWREEEKRGEERRPLGHCPPLGQSLCPPWGVTDVLGGTDGP